MQYAKNKIGKKPAKLSYDQMVSSQSPGVQCKCTMLSIVHHKFNASILFCHIELHFNAFFPLTFGAVCEWRVPASAQKTVQKASKNGDFYCFVAGKGTVLLHMQRARGKYFIKVQCVHHSHRRRSSRLLLSAIIVSCQKQCNFS